MDRNDTTKEQRTANSTYKKLAVQCSADTFVVAESFVLRINICGENRQLLVAANRWATYKKPTAETAHLVFADTKTNAEKTKRAVFCQR